MAKVKNNDLDELDFSFGVQNTKKTTTAKSTVTTKTSVTVSDTVEDSSSTTSVVNTDKLYKQPVVIPEGSSDATDSRYLINSTDDITGHTMWNVMVGNYGGKTVNYSNVYQGMQVYVKKTKDIMVYVGPTTMNGVLVSDATDLNNWVTLKNNQNVDKTVTSVTINDKYVSTISADGTRLNIDMAGTKVPYKDNTVTPFDVDYIKKIMGDTSITVGDKYPDITNIVDNIYSRITIEGNDI